MKASELWKLSRASLEEMMARGSDIDPDAIANMEFRGVSLGLPALIERLTWKTFKKVFCRDPSGMLRGWNVRIEQTGLAPPYVPRMKEGVPETFGHFAVELRPRGLELNYGHFASAFDPLRFVRDPLVCVTPGDSTLLLGTTHLDLPMGRVSTPSFFTLELEGPLSRCESPPRADR